MYNLPVYELSEMVQNLPIYAAYACAAAVGVCTVGACALWVARKYAREGRKIAAVSLVGAMLIGGMVVVGTDDAGSKPGTNDVSQVEGSTNAVTQTEGSTNVLGGAVQGRARSPSAPQRVANGENNCPSIRRVRRTRPTEMVPVTDDDIARRWRVVSVSSNSVDASVFAIEQSDNRTISCRLGSRPAARRGLRRVARSA